MKPNVRAIIEDCIERGIEDGLRRSRKHLENPSDSSITQSVMDSIWLHIDQYFTFEEEF